MDNYPLFSFNISGMSSTPTTSSTSSTPSQTQEDDRNRISGPMKLNTINIPDGRKLLLIYDIHRDGYGCEDRSTSLENVLDRLFDADPQQTFDFYLEMGNHSLSDDKSQLSNKLSKDFISYTNKNLVDSYYNEGYLLKIIRDIGICFNNEIQKRAYANQKNKYTFSDNPQRCKPNVNYYPVNIRHSYEHLTIRKQLKENHTNIRDRVSWCLDLQSSDTLQMAQEILNRSEQTAEGLSIFDIIKAMAVIVNANDNTKIVLLKSLVSDRLSKIKTINTQKQNAYDCSYGAILFDIFTILSMEIKAMNAQSTKNIIIYAGSNHIFHIKQYILKRYNISSTEYSPTTNYILLYQLMNSYAKRYENNTSQQYDTPDKILRFMNIISSNNHSRCFINFNIQEYFKGGNGSIRYDVDNLRSENNLRFIGNDALKGELDVKDYKIYYTITAKYNTYNIIIKKSDGVYILFEYKLNTNILKRVACMSSKTGNRLLQLNDTNVGDRSTLLLTSQLSTRQMDAKKRESSMISEETQQPLSPQPISAIRSNDSELQFLEDIRQRDNEFRFIDREYKITDSLTLVFDGPCVMYKVIETYDYYYSVYLELVNYKDNVRHGYQFKNDYLNYHSLYFNGQLTSRYQVPQTEPKQIQNVSYLSDEGYNDDTLTPDPDMCYDR